MLPMNTGSISLGVRSYEIWDFQRFSLETVFMSHPKKPRLSWILVVVLVLENPDRFAIRLTEQISCRTSVSLRSRNPNAPRTSTCGEPPSSRRSGRRYGTSRLGKDTRTLPRQSPSRREPDSLRPAAHDGNHFPRREMSGSQMEMDDLFGGAFASGAEVEKLAEGAML